MDMSTLGGTRKGRRVNSLLRLETARVAPAAEDRKCQHTRCHRCGPREARPPTRDFKAGKCPPLSSLRTILWGSSTSPRIKRLQHYTPPKKLKVDTAGSGELLHPKPCAPSYAAATSHSDAVSENATSRLTAGTGKQDKIAG